MEHTNWIVSPQYPQEWEELKALASEPDGRVHSTIYKK